MDYAVALRSDAGFGVDAIAIADVNADGLEDIAVHVPRLALTRVISGKDSTVLSQTDLSPQAVAR